MAKRFTAIFFIVLGIAVFLTIGFFLVLILAPGFEAFGMKYISIGARSYDSGFVVVSDEIGDFSGSLSLEVEEVPVYVYYSDKVHSLTVKYHDDYSGFTRTDIDAPSMQITRGDDGSAVVKAIGFKKFLFLNANTSRYVSIQIPLSMVSGSNSYKNSLTIKSKTSDIEFSKVSEGEDLRVASMNKVELETSGNIKYNTLVQANTYKLTTPNSIRIDSDYSTVVKATNYDLVSKKGRITAEVPVDGDFSAETYLLDIKLVSCRNLKIKSTHGDVKCYNDDEKINVSGTVNIQNKSGNVELGIVSGTGENVINTSSGSVEINKIKNGSITTQRGGVRISSVNNMTINTNMGKVFVEESLEKVNITTKRGNVTLGGNAMTVCNPTVFSRLGKIIVYSASQTVNLETIKSDITFTNKDSANITIRAGKKLTATGLTGIVNLSANENVDIEFDKISNTSTIELGDSCKSVVIKATNNMISDTRYILSGALVTRYEDNANGSGTYSKIESGTDLTNKLNGIEPLLKVTGKNADISIYLRAENVEEE